MSLKRLAVSGVKWSAASQFGRLGMQLLTVVILARLLSPSDFGLMGMAMVVIGFIGLFKDLGTSAAVIQQKELSEDLLSSIFFVNMGFGLMAMLVLYAFSPLIAAFYHEPRVTPLLRVLSLTFFISGLSIAQKALMERELTFSVLAKIELVAIAAGAVIGIGAAFLERGVWSLVYQSLTVVAVTTVLLWTASRWRPKLRFHWGQLKAVSSYSLNLTGYSILNYITRNADNLLIGRYLGAQSLGYYNLAYRLLLFPLQNIARVIGRVMFPVFSKVQDDHETFRRAYLKTAAYIGLIAFPLMLGLAALCEPFVLGLLGEKWRPIIVLLMILAPVGMVQSIGTTVGPIYQAKGRTDWMLRWAIVVNIVVVPAFVVGLRWGVVGVATAYALASMLLTYPNFAIPFRLIDLKVRSLQTLLWRTLVCSLVMLVVLIGIQCFVPLEVNVWMLALLVAAGVLVYGLVSWYYNREQVEELWSLMKAERS